METTVTKHEGPGGRVAYDVTITLGGNPFTAGGGSLDPVAGIAVGYPSARKNPLPGEAKHFLGVGGGEIPAMDLRLEREYSVWPPGAYHSVRIYCWSGVSGGRRYHGRNSGVGMLLRMRAR